MRLAYRDAHSEQQRLLRRLSGLSVRARSLNSSALAESSSHEVMYCLCFRASALVTDRVWS